MGPEKELNRLEQQKKALLKLRVKRGGKITESQGGGERGPR